jgi:hypothetical protein
MTLVRGGALAVLLGSALAACAQLPPPQDPARPGAATASARETASPRFIGVVGTPAQHSPQFLGVPETNFYCLRSFVDSQTGETQHQLYVSDSYSGAERRWKAARNDAGHPLRFIEIGRNEITCDGGCSYLEEFAASIPESDLRASPQGLTVVFLAGSGAEKRISVSGAQISAQFAAVDNGRNSVRPATAPAAPQSSASHQ